MKRYLISIMLCVAALQAQTPPIGYTRFYGFGKWAQGANPGATALNAFFTRVDSMLYMGYLGSKRFQDSSTASVRIYDYLVYRDTTKSWLNRIISGDRFSVSQRVRSLGRSESDIYAGLEAVSKGLDSVLAWVRARGDGTVAVGKKLYVDGALQMGSLYNLQGSSQTLTTLGSNTPSLGTGRFDSPSVLELVNRPGMVDGDDQQTHEIDWVTSVNTGSGTKKKIAAIEVFLSGDSTGDRGGKIQIDTKSDGGVLTNAIIIDNEQRTTFAAQARGMVGTAAIPSFAFTGDGYTTGSYLSYSGGYIYNLSVEGVQQFYLSSTTGHFNGSLSAVGEISSNTSISSGGPVGLNTAPSSARLVNLGTNTALTGTTQEGIYNTVEYGGGAVTPTTAIRGFYTEIDIANASFTVPNVYSHYIANMYRAGGTASVTNQYGLYIEQPTGATSGNYAIYTAGGTHSLNGNVYFGGTSGTYQTQVIANSLNAFAVSTVGGGVKAYMDSSGLGNFKTVTTTSLTGLTSLVITGADAGAIILDVDAATSFRGLYVRGASAANNIAGSLNIGTGTTATAGTGGLYVHGHTELRVLSVGKRQNSTNTPFVIRDYNGTPVGAWDSLGAIILGTWNAGAVTSSGAVDGASFKTGGVTGYLFGTSGKSASDFAAATHDHSWANITTGLPTTLSGYGITDGARWRGYGTSDPASGNAEGDLFYRTDLTVLRVYANGAWRDAF